MERRTPSSRRSGPGRRPKPPAERRRVVVAVRFTRSEYRSVRKQAGLDPVGTWLWKLSAKASELETLMERVRRDHEAAASMLATIQTRRQEAETLLDEVRGRAEKKSG